MKHLVSKEHHPHLRRRAILEAVGLIALIGISIQQRSLIATALKDIRSSDVLFLGVLLSLYWLLLPLTSLSYRLLARRRISIRTSLLAQLAAAGPGRIIPGGLGHISIGAMHLHHIGISMQRAVAITITNNLIGLFTNMGIVIVAIVVHPNLLDTIVEQLSVATLTLIFLAILILTSLFLWLSHLQQTRGTVRRFMRQSKKVIGSLVREPSRGMQLIVIASVITLGHASMLVVAGNALNISISLSDAIIALSAGVFIGGAVPTPGGIGAVEAGTISGLVLLGYNPSDAASAALLFRVATYWQPLVPGIVSYLYLRERKLL
jgi:uncharacterized protein (TIRG00374 family)